MTKTINTIKEGKLNNRPTFYRSLTKNMTISRLRDLDVKVNLPYITEYLEATATLETVTIKFKETYKKIPLVLGLFIHSELGQEVCQPIFPDNTWMFVEQDKVTIGKVGGNELEAGDRVKLRVYNLDLYE